MIGEKRTMPKLKEFAAGTEGATLAAVASMLRNHGVGEIHAVVVARGSVEVG